MPEKTLYALAARLPYLLPLRFLSENMLFAAQLPSGGICYCRVTQKPLTLVIHDGLTGLAGYRASLDAGGLSSHEQALSQQAIRVSTVRHRDLDPVEAALLHIQGGYRWWQWWAPRFERLTPHAEPYHGLELGDEEIVTAGMQAAIGLSVLLVTAMLRPEHLGLHQYALPGLDIPLFDGYSLDGTHTLPKTPAPEIASATVPPTIRDDLRRARLLKLPKHSSWACGLYRSPFRINNDDATSYEAVFYPFLFFVVDCDDGHYIHMGMNNSPNDWEMEILDEFLEAFAMAGRPYQIYVPDERTYALLSTAMAQIGVEVVLGENTDMLDEAYEDFMTSMEEACRGG